MENKYGTNVTVTMKDDLLSRVRKIARAEGRTLSGWLRYLAQQEVEKQEGAA